MFRRLLLLALLVTMSACGSGDADGEATVRTVRDGLVGQVIGASSDLDSREFAEDAVADCMRERGFDYEPEPVTDPFDPSALTRQDAEARGFGLSLGGQSDQVESLGGDSPNERRFAAMSDQERDTWLSAASACRDEAFRTLDERQRALLEELGTGLRDEIETLRDYTHPDLAPAVERWSECMAEQGFAFDAPWELVITLVEEFELVDVDDETALRAFQEHERELAVASYDCQEAHLDEPFEDVLSELEARVVDQVGEDYDLFAR